MLAQTERSSLGEMRVGQPALGERSEAFFLETFSHFNTCRRRNGGPWRVSDWARWPAVPQRGGPGAEREGGVHDVATQPGGGAVG